MKAVVKARVPERCTYSVRECESTTHRIQFCVRLATASIGRLQVHDENSDGETVMHHHVQGTTVSSSAS